MKNRIIKNSFRLLIFGICIWFMGSNTALAQVKVQRWLRVSDLQTPVNNIGAIYEGEITTSNTDFFHWPAAYGADQQTKRCDALWIGCRNYDDPVANKQFGTKVIGVGPRDDEDGQRPQQFIAGDIKLIGKYYHPIVVVDDQNACNTYTYDLVDEVDPDLPCDRMIAVTFNTSVGVSVTEKVMQFANSEHGNYVIKDYVFKNTGIYNAAGDVKQQTLQDVYFYFNIRAAFAGESCTDYASSTLGWGSWNSTWGESNVYFSFGEDLNATEYTDPTSPYYQLRGFWAFQGPDRNRSALNYAEDWGCPHQTETGIMSAAKFLGWVTLHADKSATDKTNDLTQPKTTWYLGADIDCMQAGLSQFDEIMMATKYGYMSEGHPAVGQHHTDMVGDDYPIQYTDPVRQSGGGPSQGQGFGPYTLAFGDSVHIVFAEAVDGISREKNREVGARWLQWYSNTDQPELKMPDGSTTTDFNLYKRRWVESCKDSILKTLSQAKANFESNYSLSAVPPPPDNFTVASGGDKISLSWASNASSEPGFDGYVIYRSIGTAMTPDAVYTKIFECDASNAVHSFDDVSAIRGNDYYYYIQTKGSGSINDANPGVPVYSSLYWTMTNVEATLQRPAITSTLDSVRVVPNPYNVRSRLFSFGGGQTQYDRIAFYGLPPVCQLKIYTERGDLIWEKDHTRGTGDELWDSRTSSGQMIVSGIYILYVEAPDGRNVIRKFVVIR